MRVNTYMKKTAVINTIAIKVKTMISNISGLETCVYWANVGVIAALAGSFIFGGASIILSHWLNKSKDEQNRLQIENVKAGAKKYTADVEASTKLQIEKTRADADIKIEDTKAEAAKANERAETAITEQVELKRKNLELQSRIEKERSGRLEMESAIAPRIMEQRQTAKELEGIKGISVIVESLAESEPWRTAGQIAWTLNSAKWNILPGMQRFLDATGFFDGVAIESNVGPKAQEDHSSEAADALVEVLTKNNIQANRRPAINLPLNTIRIRVGLKPAGYFQRNRKDLEYGNMLYK